LTTFSRFNYDYHKYVNNKHLIPAKDGQFTPAKGDQSHWFLHTNTFFDYFKISLRYKSLLFLDQIMPYCICGCHRLNQLVRITTNKNHPLVDYYVDSIFDATNRKAISLRAKSFVTHYKWRVTVYTSIMSDIRCPPVGIPINLVECT
jgi:hypothetical protein